MVKDKNIDPENFLIITKNSEIRNNNDLKNVYLKSVKLLLVISLITNLFKKASKRNTTHQWRINDVLYTFSACRTVKYFEKTGKSSFGILSKLSIYIIF